jgi:hypothetical protein
MTTEVRKQKSLFKFRRGAAIAFFASLLACLLAPVSFGGTVSGIVHNGTTGQTAAGIDVILIQLQGGMQPVANTKTDAQGAFHFDNPGIGTGPMLIRAVYKGVNYHEPLPPGKPTVEIQVFDPTEKAGSITIPAHAIIVQPNGDHLLVGEEYNVENKTKPPMAFYKADGSFVFSLPEGAQLNDVSAAGSSGMPVVQGTIDKGKNVEAIAYAFRPGDSGVRVSYKLPYPNNQTKVRFVSHYAEDRVAVFAPPTIQVSGEGFQPAGQDQGFKVYMRESVAANTPLEVSLSGSGPAPRAQSGGGNSGGAASGASEMPPADNSQNPSVNSRLEQSGAEAPTATATTMPARLDSLKWILVAGFAAIFALGLVFLWKRPQFVGAAGGAAVMSAGGSVATRATKTKVQRPAAAELDGVQVNGAETGRAETSPAAEVEREVRGSLEEIKDSLFRLELRRQAGTIGEEQYAAEKQRIEKFLRDFVRG